MCSYSLFYLFIFCEIVSCRDFYAGMFRTDDYLVAQDRLYKEKVPFRTTVAKYGRYFKCHITYFRVVDRLGVGGGPHVLVTRGGLRKKFLTLKLTSPYNLPISVNIYVGCAKYKKKVTTTTTTMATTTAAGNDTSSSPGDDVTTPASGNETAATGGDETTAAAGGDTTPAAGDETTTPGGDETTPAVEETTPPPA
ncbi:hypothetical protein MSG28_004794 [Choristoneura fumiferana]|uniref:Uncharacterized protein n=1 Tax=Choristoneura fumiferana TaxID=7141 RepID=A0ACC0K7L1_CHOFU|nr:hypothetical protein MSG28_004794 [Choristoneura fumiferana]